MKKGTASLCANWRASSLTQVRGVFGVIFEATRGSRQSPVAPQALAVTIAMP
jgi:hypothetical protein